jgi:NTP pyrophosphatase (non-canonical NTP hydrolase)
MDIEEIQQHVSELRASQGWRETSLEQRVVFLMSEVGEVAREVLKLSGACKEVEVEQAREKLGMEMYDVIWNICDLANLAGIDLEACFRKKADINKDRTW